MLAVVCWQIDADGYAHGNGAQTPTRRTKKTQRASLWQKEQSHIEPSSFRIVRYFATKLDGDFRD